MNEQVASERAPPAAQPITPDAPSPSTAIPATDLPPIAAKADDLEAIKKAVEDAASVGGGLWLSYLFVLFYLAVAAGAVTHEDLFFERPVKLPFLNIELPLLAFFFLAPILFIIVHAYTLVHLVMLTEKAKRYHRALHDPDRDVTGAARENLQWQLPSNIFIQFLAGPSGLRAGAFGSLLRAIAWITLVIAPVLLLLMMQVQFLPFHSSFITWTQRIALVVDLALIWWLWGKILSGRDIEGRRRGSWGWAALGIGFSLAAVLFSGATATFPGEWQEDHLPEWRLLPALAEWGKPATEEDASGNPRTASFRDWLINAEKLSLHDWLFNEQPDSASRRRFPFSSTLVLPALNIYEGLGIDDPEKVKWHEFIFRARGRDLRGAILDLATLPKVDFEGAELQRARLYRAHLPDASFDLAQLQGASFDLAQLQGASFDLAQLQGATLALAQLQGATLDLAQLQGASLAGARLQGASLAGARLQGASLVEAHLQGASLERAVPEATDLSGAFLWRTNRATPPSKVSAIRLSGGTTWLPLWWKERGHDHPWDAKAYQALRT
jgi:hypothetical protein